MEFPELEIAAVSTTPKHGNVGPAVRDVMCGYGVVEYCVGIQDLWQFLIAGMLLNITPGPDMAPTVARSTQQGVKAGAIRLDHSLGIHHAGRRLPFICGRHFIISSNSCATGYSGFGQLSRIPGCRNRYLRQLPSGA